ncbi:restriction endonuclease [Ramlibacter henchirensis]|uniref:Restriction endonuclease n=1 Tax=Ramlibacter henchirensis TaxID=204072 RepID=A0A4Z0BVR9_9BURK|nr:restriction endonuclease [Ramlibacter henchirensis]TFZ02981.1 restriction endonuclease [Ramlibacter henchirensis]
MAGKLDSDGALKSAIDSVQAATATAAWAQEWYARLGAFLVEVRAAAPSKLADPAFLLRLWDENPVAGTGAGTVKIAPALKNEQFRAWFAEEASRALPSDRVQAEAQLKHFYTELRTRTKELCGRTPSLKINRVLCALYPDHFTCLADVGALLTLHKEMGGSTTDHPIDAHQAIRSRVDTVLGAAAADDEEVRRICLPWLLYDWLNRENVGESEQAELGSPATLKPLPATLRRKGLTAMKGGFQTLLSFMEDLREGLTREEFASLMQQANPDLASGSLGAAINVVAREFDLCRREGDTYRLSARGLNLLETQDPDELRDHLLTKVLGIDHVLTRLAREPSTKPELVSLLQTIHPGWTSDFAPTSLLGWLVSLDLIALRSDRKYALTPRGVQWAELVTWTPQALPSQPDVPAEKLQPVSAGTLGLPSFTQLTQRIAALAGSGMRFDPLLVSQLHAGLWAHPVRHFAVLSGISGSGKTQLAVNYALALTGSEQATTTNVRIIPVQPGWFDPSPLLGYVNPLQETSYRGAPFLELLLRAVDDPTQPYVAVLDEMNLSHPEQYLAPVLSAMETHGWLDLHQLGQDAIAVPARVQYPANLAIIGTLNMDETTHGLSDKVLDRAYTLEFWDIDVDGFPGWKTADLPTALKERTRAVLNGLGKALSPVRLHFGWRTIDDVVRHMEFMATVTTVNGDTLDAVIYAKVLPKLRGDANPRFQDALQDARKVLGDHDLKRCERKVKEMQEDLKQTGSARFWR